MTVTSGQSQGLDPAIRERKREYARQYNAKRRKDPVVREQMRQYDRERHARIWQDPEWRAHKAEYMRVRRAHRKKLLNRFKLFKGCALCGYREHASALIFHHRDPSQKRGQVHEFHQRSMTVLRKELSKCDVLCANCHAIHHAEMR